MISSLPCHIDRSTKFIPDNFLLWARFLIQIPLDSCGGGVKVSLESTGPQLTLAQNTPRTTEAYLGWLILNPHKGNLGFFCYAH